jgi:hypothetical protein
MYGGNLVINDATIILIVITMEGITRWFHKLRKNLKKKIKIFRTTVYRNELCTEM